MLLRPGPVVLVAGGLLLFPAVAAADTITLLSPTARTSEPPPLVGKRIAGATVGETRFSGRLRNVERIAVGIDRSGAPVGVVATQRLTISRPGDFTFLVPAPATKVVAAPGSQAEPGLRDLGIVWQGFASGRRILAATITLAPAAAAVLPLRVSVERRAGAIVVRLEDVARGRFTVTTGSVAPAAVTAFLDRLRREGTTTVVPSQLALPGSATGHTVIGVTAPLRVRGTIAGPGRAPVAVSVVLGAGRPTTQTFTVPGRALPSLDLRVDPLGAIEILPGPRDPAPSLADLQRVLGSVALAREYHRFLDSPDPSGPSTAVYAYRTVQRLPVLAAGGRSPGGDDTLTIVLVAVLGAAALVGGVVLWAHL
jgi:hypothetical protein